MTRSEVKEAHVKNMPIKTTLYFAWTMVRMHKAVLAAMIACTCLFAGVELAMPVLGKKLFDSMTGEAGTGMPTDPAQVWQWLILFFIFSGFFWIFRYGMYLFWIPFSAHYMRRVVQVAFERVQTFSTSWHNDTFAGVTVRNLTRGMRALDGVLELLVTQFLPTFLFVAGTAVYLAYIGHPWQSAGLLGFAVVFMTITGMISLKIVSPLNQASNDADSKLGGLIADSITCNATVKSFGKEKAESARLRDWLDQWRILKVRAWYAGTWNGVLQTVLIVAMRIAFLTYVVHAWLQGRATVGDVFFYFSIMAVVVAYLRDFGSQLRQLQNHVNDLDPVAAYMQMSPSVVDAPDARPLQVTRGEIVFERVTFGYKPELPPLFQDLSVTLEAGKTAALVGRSGSGKTSFVKLVQRLYDVQGGRILIDGQDITHCTLQSLHQAVALVSQEPVLFHRTLAENIAYARPDATFEQIRAAAHDAFIDDFIMSLPDQYETLVGERGVKLSGGERQRVAIARALLADKPILVMDEATSSLDSVSETLIQQALETLKAGRTTLIIAHRLSTIREADRILVFEQGRVAEEGTHAALLAKNGAYKALYDAQIQGFIV